MPSTNSQYKLYISPCPNDTFIFEALIKGQIPDFPTGSLRTEFADIERLNQLALQAQADIIKVSFGIMHKLKTNYNLLKTGAALGFGVGPLLISNSPQTPLNEVLKIAIPGENTTANLLFDLYYTHEKTRLAQIWPQGIEKYFIPFAEIATKVAQKQYHAGVLIHEERFTYQQYQLECLADLGDFWEQQFGLPIPLGGIIVRKNLPKQEQIRIEKAIAQSLRIAQKNYPQISDFVRQHAQTMHAEVMRKHINLYVNKYSLELDAQAMQAINLILNLHRG